MKSTALITALTLQLYTVQACSRRTGGDEPGGMGSSSPQAVSTSQTLEKSRSPAFHYPPARWRLATFDELDRTTLWIGHIAILHEKSDTSLFRGPAWRPDPPNPARTVNQARAMAEQIAAWAAATPDDFEQLARAHSEDVVSKEDGGMLGGVRASQLTANDFLDPLATLKPGEISRAFATPYGFHILKRYPPPQEQEVAGERIVIGYKGAFGLVGQSQRSRAEALALARKVADDARKSPKDFRRLVERHSECVDRVRHGDLGVHSTRDPGYLPVEIFHLARIDVGDVTGPIDSRWGFEILKRVTVSPRVEYATRTIELPFDVTPGQREAAQARALEKAQSVRRALEAEPNRFEEFQGAYCCDRVQRWTEGRGPIELSRALDALSFGEIARKPLLVASQYLLVKRLDPSALPPEKPRLTELPNPSEPDYEELLKYNGDGRHVAEGARALVNELKKSSELSPEATEAAVKTIEQQIAFVEQHLDEPGMVRSAIRSTLVLLKGQLSPDQFSRFKEFARGWITRGMMPPGSSSEPAR